MREDIIIAIEALMKKVTSAKYISREFKPLDDIASTQFPAIIIEDDGVETITWKTGDVADISFEVNLIGYVNQLNGVSSALNKLDAEIKKVIFSDLTLGGKVAIIRVLPYTERSGSKFAPYGFFERPVRITYEGTLAGGL